MWARRRQEALLHVRSQRRAEYLVGQSAPGTDAGAAKRVTTFRDGRVLVALDHAKTARRSRSSATSASGRSTRQRARRAKCRSRCAARRRVPPSSTGRSAIRCRSWRSRRTERRSPSRSTASFLCLGEGRRRRGAHHIDRRRGVRSSRGRPTAATWSTCPSRTGTRHSSSTTSATGGETQLTTGNARNDLPRYLAGRQVDRVRARLARAARHRSGVEGQETLVATGVFDTPPFVDARDSLVARLALHRLLHRRRESLSERARRAGGWRQPRSP